MKKLLSFLACFIAAVGASSQDWEVVTHEGQAQDKTIILADLVVNYGSPVYEGNYEIAVFVGDECRMIVSDDDEDLLQTVNGTKFLQFIVPGTYGNESDEGKTITFELCDANGAVYDITPSSPTITFRDGDTYGGTGSSDRVQLALTLPTSISLKPFEVEVGESINLLGQIDIVPEKAQLPQNYIWSVNDEEYATIEGDVLTAIRVPSVDEEDPELYLEFGEEAYDTPFTIIQHATAINIVTAEIEVNKNGAEDLSMFMRNLLDERAYELVPSDATDKVLWEIDDSYISQEAEDVWKPIKGGTTRIRPYIVKTDNSKLYPVTPAWITVNIIVPIEGAYFRWGADGETPTEEVTFKCNVGDDIYQRLADRVVILPEDVVDKTFTIGFGEDSDENMFTIGIESIVAKKAGETTLVITPKGIDGEDYWIKVFIEVFNPAKTISAVEKPLIIDSQTSLDEAGADIYENITFGPAGSEPDGEIVALDGGVFEGSGSFESMDFIISSPEELVSGETTVRATLRWNDYSSYDGTDETIVEQTASVEFVVNIIDVLQSLGITITPDSDDPTKGTITLTPYPDTAVFSWDDYGVGFENDAYGDWEALTITPKDNGIYDFVASLPGVWRIYVVGGGFTPNSSYSTLVVPAKVSLQSGWQWKSNNWGTVYGNEVTDFFGENLIEARTYNDLLYNDPEWGFWGSMMDYDPNMQIFGGIEQDQMYKVKMKAAKDSYISDGGILEYPGEFLFPGWNWVGSPYFYDRTIEHAFDDLDVTDGLVIVSKAEGQIEMADGEWSGNLKLIRKGQGYYVYNPDADGIWLSFNAEVGKMEQGDETSAGARAKSRSVWHYDHSQFAGNMTMVASFSDLENPEEYTIGAFVDGECRGEGSFDRGLAFITVHTDGGEEVTFRLHNELTDEYFDIDQTVVSRMRIGSVKAPMQLTSNSVVTGIATVGRSASNVESYDLNGRAVDGNAKGITIRKMQDGTVKKVVRK